MAVCSHAAVSPALVFKGKTASQSNRIDRFPLEKQRLCGWLAGHGLSMRCLVCHLNLSHPGSYVLLKKTKKKLWPLTPVSWYTWWRFHQTAFPNACFQISWRITCPSGWITLLSDDECEICETPWFLKFYVFWLHQQPGLRVMGLTLISWVRSGIDSEILEGNREVTDLQN